MHKKLALVFLLTMMSTILFAQTATVQGSIKDTTAALPVKNAVVLLLSPKDSVLRGFTRTKADGSFSIEKIQPGSYILMVMHPLFADFVDDVQVKAADNNLPVIPITSKSKLLQAVILKSGSPIKIKGDTTIYTADSFKVSANANVEELLKKLPGIQVDKNGEIKAMGEKVEKVLVDGEEFFGDDPGMAVKNLRADAVKEVQVFDKKSEQAEFTGIDDGKTQKTINLKLKEDKKTGYFGKVDLAGGLLKDIDDRYNNNLMFSTFKGKRKLSTFLLTGNTGQDGLSWQDNEKYGGESDNYSMGMDDDGGYMYMWRGGSSDDEPYVNTENGFIRNINAGLQYSNKWNDKQTFNLSPKYNSQVYDNTQQNFSQTFLPGNTSLVDSSNKDTHINRYNFKLSSIYDVKIDSANTLKLTVKANFYHTESEEDYQLRRTDQDKNLFNVTDRFTKLNSDKQSYTANAIFKHKFRKLRRTLSLTADWNLLQTDGTSFLQSYNEDFLKGSVVNVDQKKETEKSSQKFSSKIVYTEPLSKKYSLEIGHEISYTLGNNDQTTYSYNSGSGKYDTGVDSLTNDFNQKIMINRPSARISYSGKKIKFNFGAGVGFTHFDFIDKTENKDYIRNYTNFFPAANFTYTYKANHSLRFNYNGNTTQPTLNQLQPLTNNNDQYNQYIGNPDLKQSFSNTFNLSHNGYNFLKDRWMYQSLNVSVTSNSITNSRIYDGGNIITQPVNTNGNINASLWAGIGFKLKKLDMRLNVQPNLNYTKFADVINGITNFSKNLNTGLGLYLSKSKDKKYDLSVGNNFGYTSNRVSQNNSNSYFTTNTLSVDATIYYKKVWSISSDFQYYYRGKTSDFDQAQNNNLWNARLQRTFKNNEFTVYVKVRDILNQNIGIDRNYYGNTYTETRNDRLKRYFLLGFAWDFKNKAAKTK